MSTTSPRRDACRKSAAASRSTRAPTSSGPCSATSRYGEWNEVHVGFPDGPPELAEGVSFREKVTIMGMPGEATWRVVELDVPTKLVLDGDGPMGVKLAMSLEVAAQNGGSKVTMTSSFDGPPLAGPMGDAVAKAGGEAADKSLAKVRALFGWR
ncbi:SRPBCC family protein [Conexibacter sp. W3-3-2]|uniref:type II toxin-antitoxin system Rv0910 family toxin n=1 Tax=Conexibacter sp. W3-3-2 TaxID=2675227 RepID=UPI0012B6F2EC|nr:SRPBCC family protein [Conexibacter sp. W3-3-2]MTD47751.1 SRPBCC family protein [Conexibacter sp. W3-3-2]